MPETKSAEFRHFFSIDFPHGCCFSRPFPHHYRFWGPHGWCFAKNSDDAENAFRTITVFRALFRTIAVFGARKTAMMRKGGLVRTVPHVRTVAANGQVDAWRPVRVREPPFRVQSLLWTSYIVLCDSRGRRRPSGTSDGRSCVAPTAISDAWTGKAHLYRHRGPSRLFCDCGNTARSRIGRCCGSRTQERLCTSVGFASELKAVLGPTLGIPCSFTTSMLPFGVYVKRLRGNGVGERASDRSSRPVSRSRTSCYLSNVARPWIPFHSKKLIRESGICAAEASPGRHVHLGARLPSPGHPARALLIDRPTQNIRFVPSKSFRFEPVNV